jgi:hypothetical protein
MLQSHTYTSKQKGEYMHKSTSKARNHGKNVQAKLRAQARIWKNNAIIAKKEMHKEILLEKCASRLVSWKNKNQFLNANKWRLLTNVDLKGA